MRVMMVSKACLVGAYQRKLEEIARYDDVELTVVVPSSWRDERGELPLERAYTEGYDLVVEPIRFNGSFHTHYYPRLGRRISRLKPELVHIDEEPYNWATTHTMYLARRGGARTLFFSWQNLNRRYPIPFRWFEGYVLRHTDYGIVGNHSSAEVWRSKGYNGPLSVIPQFGVDPDIFKPGRRDRDPGRGFVIGFAGGRLVREKGADLLIEAASALPGTWRLVLAGSGPEQDRLEQLVQELGKRDRVFFDGQIPSTRMPAYYNQLDVLVLPSRALPNWKEQFGRVLVEAMACGVPVVGSDSGEIPNVIADAGLVFPENDVAGLRNHLLKLQQRPELRRELSQRGRQRVLDHYTQAQIAAQTVQVYREVMRGTSACEPPAATGLRELKSPRR
jgi:glycosyltransferase involved in cell wall biosynthesis